MELVEVVTKTLFLDHNLESFLGCFYLFQLSTCVLIVYNTVDLGLPGRVVLRCLWVILCLFLLKPLDISCMHAHLTGLIQ